MLDCIFSAQGLKYRNLHYFQCIEGTTWLFRNMSSGLWSPRGVGVDFSCLWFFCSTFSGFLHLLLQMDGYERIGDRNRERTEHARVS